MINPILIDKFLDNATEVDVDCIADREISVIGSIMEHIEPAGVHSGDSACIIPTVTLSDKALAVITQAYSCACQRTRCMRTDECSVCRSE